MKFKPFGSKYVYDKAVLVRNFPDYMRPTIANWLYDVLRYSVIDENRYSSYRAINQSFQHSLHIEFRETFPNDWGDFIKFVFADDERLCNVLALCLQNYANKMQADYLEYVLSQGGSAYEVACTDEKATEYAKGVYDLSERVPTTIKTQSEAALTDNDLLLEAWNSCYSHNPDYEKVVSRACDFLEDFLGKIYFPKDPKPQLKKFIHAFEDDPSKLTYKGDALVEPKSTLTSLLREATNIRGQHTKGKGRKPTKQEAEFVLHTTIYIWNLHQK